MTGPASTPPVATVRTTPQAKQQLATLKRRTTLRHWNTICRWAFCLSLRESSPPPALNATLDGGVTMTWVTFGGEEADLYAALLDARLVRDGLDVNDPAVRAEQFHRHLHRGINRMAGDTAMTSGPEELMRFALAAAG
jgi:DNA sulfur modification protein DndE